MDNNRKFVDIFGISEGGTFISRRELSKAAVPNLLKSESMGFNQSVHTPRYYPTNMMTRI